MDKSKFEGMSDRERCAYYRQKIAELTPPTSELSKRLIETYQLFLEANEGHHTDEPPPKRDD